MQKGTRETLSSLPQKGGLLFPLSGREVKININYCHDCDLCFISLDEYKAICERHGSILGNFRFVNAEKRNGMYTLADQSVLKLCGYNVDQNHDLTENQRRLILENMLVRNIVDKDQVIRYLSFFINNGKNRRGMELACRRWKDDLEWVRYYNIDRQRSFIINRARRYR